MKAKVFMFVLLVVAASVIALIVNRQPAAEKVSRRLQPVIRHTSAAPRVAEKVQPQPESPKSDIPEALKSPTPSAPVVAVKPTNSPPTHGPRRELQDPLARVALAYVGQVPEDP